MEHNPNCAIFRQGDIRAWCDCGRGDDMATGNFQKCLEEILRWEGGYSDHPHDKGGVTNRGVTKATYQHWLGRKVSDEEMKNLTVEDVRPVYEKLFWKALRCDELPSGVDLCCFDFAVNAGVSRSAKLMQSIVGANPDGIIGKQTIGLISKENPVELIREFQRYRREFYRKLKTFSIFGKGWIRRVEDIEEKAVKMAGQSK